MDTQNGTPSASVEHTVDVLVVGAGFAGLRTLIEMNRRGRSAVALDAADDVGGTWYWNRYPGARTDSESWNYCFSFSDSLLEEWDWAERYPTQGEVYNYLRHVTEKFDLRGQLRLQERVKSAVFDDTTTTWTVETNRGTVYACKYLVTGLGFLSDPYQPAFPGEESFTGRLLLTSRWPKDPIDFRGRRVAVVGTGASGVQAIPIIAAQADQLTVFQRTPNYVIPAGNHALTDDDRRRLKADYSNIWSMARRQVFAYAMSPAGRMYDDVVDADRKAILEKAWERGGFQFMFETFDDILLDPRENDAVSDFIRSKIRAIVDNPTTAELLCPKGYPFIGKRPPLGHSYYETYNRPNVHLVDINHEPIEEITPDGIRTSAEARQFDDIVLATGFDAVTGSFDKIDIRGLGGHSLKDTWVGGVQTHLGVTVPGFPNMFMICGPQTSYANIPVVIDFKVEWIADLLDVIDKHGAARVEVTREAAEAWDAHVQAVTDMTVLPQGEKVGSWYLGANIPGKPRKMLFYFGGSNDYFDRLDATRANDFEGYVFR